MNNTNGNSTGCNSEEEISCDISSRLPSDTFMLPFYTTDTTFMFHSPTRWSMSQEGTAADWITGLSLDGGSTNVTNNLMGTRRLPSPLLMHKIVLQNPVQYG